MPGKDSLMRNKISILCIVFACIFLASGCSLSKKDRPQEKSTDEAPLQIEQRNGTMTRNDSIGKAEELKNEETIDGKIAYITIDDGPSRNNTVAILDTLKKNGYRYFDWDVSVADTDPNLKNYGDEKFIINLMI